MLAQVHSFVLQGIEPIACEIEVDVAERGLAKTTIVGLPDAAVKESIERVRSAIGNSGFPFPMTRLLVSLAPGDIRKEGPIFDLPIAVGLLLAERAIQTQRHKRFLFAGELALDGRLRPIGGVINLALLARRMGMEGVVVPVENASEAAAVTGGVGEEGGGVGGGFTVYPADSLATVVGFLNEEIEIEPEAEIDFDAELLSAEPEIDFGDVRGQEAAKRALTVAAAGMHNVVMIGPQGTGKTMMARALSGVLPALTLDEALEVTRIYSCLGMVPKGRALVSRRPVRTPHHTASGVAIVGGGAVPGPGEVSLAHHGILFLDEMPEFTRAVLETLRQPLEDGEVTIARSQGRVTFPAKFMLVGALNPTPKGGKPEDEMSMRQMERYLAKLSGPLIDRVDIHVEVPAVSHEMLTSKRRGTDSATIREDVRQARAIQMARNVGGKGRGGKGGKGNEGNEGKPNRLLGGRELDRVAVLDGESQELMRQAMSELGLSARAYDKVRRVARTIADLAGREAITMPDVAEAVGYRLLDRTL